MKFRFIILLIFVCSFHNSYGYLGNRDTLYAAKLKPLGRYMMNTNKQLELISSVVHFGFSFNGDECGVYASVPDKDAHNYLQYELDGVYQKRVRLSGSFNEPLVIKNLTPGKHTVWIYKTTEAHTGPILISKIVAHKVKPLYLPKGPLIEFIGNSITCGAAADASETPCGTGVYHDQHNAYMAYGPRLARALGVNFVLSSVSGIGIYRTWNRDGPSMPQVYEKIDFQDKNPQQWDFTTFTPKVVSIALGTNDFSTGDGKTPRKPFNADEFISKYVKFIQLVKSKYPKARIALLSSPMVKGASAKLLEQYLTTVKKKVDAAYPTDKPVSTFFFAPMETRGCGGHPSVEDHLIMAQQLEPFFKKLLE